MAKFIAHGIVVEEPRKQVLRNGIDCITVTVEERYQTSFKEVVNIYAVDFMGKTSKQVPENVKMRGATVIVVGTINSREYQGKTYNDLRGESLTIVSPVVSFDETPEPYEKVEQLQDLPIANDNVDDVEVSDDDLPF